jgi:hypothetical protein
MHIELDVRGLAGAVHDAIELRDAGIEVPGFPALVACWDMMTLVSGKTINEIGQSSPEECLRIIHEQLDEILLGTATLSIKPLPEPEVD